MLILYSCTRFLTCENSVQFVYQNSVIFSGASREKDAMFRPVEYDEMSGIQRRFCDYYLLAMRFELIHHSTKFFASYG